RPFVAILGGAKVLDKIGVISNLLEKVDTLIIGGGMAYTFLKALGNDVGMSLLEEDKMSYALEMIDKAAVLGVKILLPTDHVVAKEFKNDTESKVVPRGGIHHEWEGMDIGPATIENYVATIKEAKTVIWNGPMGVFEFENFSKGTKAIAEALAATECMSIIGGGDSAAAVNQFGFGEKMSHISTGGGASLVLLEGSPLPGLEAVDNL
ncbi:MAG TPA: phosphoglycerate kinase, partial [Sulfurovum sp.]|nr:phosphoglycerate kinase [Sulfurovum sp.]